MSKEPYSVNAVLIILIRRHPEWQDSFQTKIPVYVGCACLGDTIGALWLCPSEKVKQQMQVLDNSWY